MRSHSPYEKTNYWQQTGGPSHAGANQRASKKLMLRARPIMSFFKSH